MKILNERPPEWIMTGCLDQFRVKVDNTFWTYGDTIYNPGGISIPEDIIAHEEQHGRQQEAYVGGCVDAYCIEEQHSLHKDTLGKDGWWREYLTNPRFRLEQESEAYGEQYRFFCENRKDRNQRYRFLVLISRQLSGPLYQLSISAQQARAIILVLSGERKLEDVAK